MGDLDGGSMSNGEIVARIIFSTAMLGLAIWSTVWVYKDSQREGKPGCVVAFLVLLTWPFGLFLWLVVRSGKPSDRGRQENQHRFDRLP